MNNLEEKFDKFKLQPDTQVQAVASLEVIDGKKYLLKTSQEKYFLLNQDLEQYEEVPEVVVASAILKHDYEPIDNGQIFEFGHRKEFLK